MKTRIAFLFFIGMVATNAHSIDWWTQSDVCRINPARCYTSMGAGYDTEFWDAGAACWGQKIICEDALTDSTRGNRPIGKKEIAAGTGIRADYDLGVLNGDCFGVRKTTSNGTQTTVNGKTVNVWCNGILANPDEYLNNGEITYGDQPTCSYLAEYGYVGIVNGKCYGKYYDPSRYYIECGAGGLLPSRIVILNGADWGYAGDGPVDTNAAGALFDVMQSVSAQQRAKYFK